VNTISRRSAMQGLTVTVVGGIVGYLFGRNSDAAKPKATTTAANGYGAASIGGGGGRRLARLDQVPEGGGLILDKDKIVLTRDSSGDVHAFSSICTHQGCPVNSVSGGAISCPCHGSQFDASSGAVLAGPAPRPLPPVAVTIQDDAIYTS
jgi:Rieske Fe-S protein